MRKKSNIKMAAIILCCTLVIGAITPFQVKAIAGDNNSRVYNNYTGPQIVINISGRSEKGDEERLAHFIPMVVKEGEYVTIERIIQAINENLNNSVGGGQDPQYEYKFKQFVNEKPKLIMDSNDGTHREVEITKDGVRIPQYSSTYESLQFSLNEEIIFTKEKRQIKYTNISDDTDVYILHKIQFIDDQSGKQLNEYHILNPGDIGDFYFESKKPGEQITDTQLQENALQVFNKSPLSKSYKFCHRVSTAVVENGIGRDKALFEYDYKEDPFIYTVNKYRPEKAAYAEDNYDTIIDRYYVSNTSKKQLDRIDRTVNINMYDSLSLYQIASFDMTAQNLGNESGFITALKMQNYLTAKSGNNLVVTNIEKIDDFNFKVYVYEEDKSAIETIYYYQPNPIDIIADTY